MKVSWNWLSDGLDWSGARENTSTPMTPKALADLLTSLGLEVEEMESQAQAFDHVVTAQILEKKPHPQADRLSLCKVSIGKGDPLDIVCGAQNMKAGDKIVLAQVGANLPNGMKIAQGKIRGEVSNGMLCSETELGFAKESEGLLILPPEAEVGIPLAEYLHKNDTIFTLKLTANRGDCLSHQGLAREIAAALGISLKPMPVGKNWSEIAAHGSSKIQVALHAGEEGRQFYGVHISGVKIGPSPEWLVRRLESVGSRSINNVVDATNFVMLELGQPTHAYDASTLKGNLVQIRTARAGEKIVLLDGSEVELKGGELVIADSENPVALAGVMGGKYSEVSESTTDLYLECAEFSPVSVRKMASGFQKHTDAAHRFERGIDPEGLEKAMARLTSLILDLAGGEIKGVSFAKNETKKKPPIVLNPNWLCGFLGLEVADEKIEKILKAQGCSVNTQNKLEWIVVAPSHRHDLSLREDLAEEVARAVGYDQIPSTVPALSSQPLAVSSEPTFAGFRLLNRAKDMLAASGLSEAWNFSFTSASWLKTLGFEPGLKVKNPLSEEHECLVPSLLPGLIQNALGNWNHHFGSESPAIRLFEIRPTFAYLASEGEAGKEVSPQVRALSETQTNTQEKFKLAFAISGARMASGLKVDHQEVDFYDVKAIVESLLQSLGSRGVRFIPLHQSRNANTPLHGLFHPGQSVEVLAGNQVAGVFGLMHPAYAKSLKARAPLWLCEIDWEMLAKLSRSVLDAPSFSPWSEFPPMERDFALVVKEEVTAEKLTALALKAGKPIAKSAKIFDVYRGSQVAQGMTSVGVRVIFFTEGRSLQESETEAASTQIIQAWKKELGADLRSS